jgi:hypothetical protein
VSTFCRLYVRERDYIIGLRVVHSSWYTFVLERTLFETSRREQAENWSATGATGLCCPNFSFRRPGQAPRHVVGENSPFGGLYFEIQF